MKHEELETDRRVTGSAGVTEVGALGLGGGGDGGRCDRGQRGDLSFVPGAKKYGRSLSTLPEAIFHHPLGCFVRDGGQLIGRSFLAVNSVKFV